MLYTIQQIAAAQPIANIVLTGPVHLTGWSDDGATLIAPNGKTVHLGFRDWLLTHAWVASNVPTSEEFGDRGGTTQRFTRCQLHWDGQSVTVETLPPPPPPPVDWHARYEELVAQLGALLKTA